MRRWTCDSRYRRERMATAYSAHETTAPAEVEELSMHSALTDDAYTALALTSGCLCHA